jgi:hypothetical protein
MNLKKLDIKHLIAELPLAAEAYLNSGVNEPDVYYMSLITELISRYEHQKETIRELVEALKMANKVLTAVFDQTSHSVQQIEVALAKIPKEYL